MPRLARYVLVLLLLLAAAPAVAQPGPGRRPRAEMPDEWQPFDVLIRQRARIGLTDGQVRRLEEIGQRLQARNRPLRERLLAERERFAAERRARMARLTPEQRRDTLRRLRQEREPRDVPPAMRPIVVEMRRNVEAARRQAENVLTPRQKARARMLVREWRERREERLERRRPHRRPPERP